MRGKYRIGDTIGLWLLRELLGSGGNGEVWKAEGKGMLVALKILRSRDPKGERYARFRSEVEVLQKLTQHKGILPLLEASLPDKPTRDNPAWIAMPPATPASKHLRNGSFALDRTIEAMAAVGKTLASLHTDNIAHRDIKPDNLFWYNNKWVIGDFGLVDFPNKSAVTRQGRKVGPMFYIAPEMLSHPDSADGRPADVYSLAKTLWALATGENFPPQGEQPADNDAISINRFFPHPRAHLLDVIVQDSTKFDPKARPTMSELAARLRRWLP